MLPGTVDVMVRVSAEHSAGHRAGTRQGTCFLLNFQQMHIRVNWFYKVLFYSLQTSKGLLNLLGEEGECF